MKLSFTCLHPHPLCNVALLWWSLGGGGEGGDEDGGGRPGRTGPQDEWSECSPAGLAPDGGRGGRSPGDRYGLLRGGGRRGSGGVLSLDS